MLQQRLLCNWPTASHEKGEKCADNEGELVEK
jgi:hypothetical protein